MKSSLGGAQRQSGGSSSTSGTNTVTMSNPYGRLTGAPAPMPALAPASGNLTLQRDSISRPYEERNILPPIQSAYGNPSSQYGFGGVAPPAPSHSGLKLPSIQAYQPQDSYAPFQHPPQPQEPQQPGPQEYDIEAYRNHYQQSRGPPRTRSIIDSQYAAGPPSNRAYISREPVIRTSSPNREMKRYRDSKLMNPTQTWNAGPSDRDRQREESSSTSPRGGGNDLRKRPSSSELPGLPRKQLHTSWDTGRKGGGSLMPISDLVSPTFPSPSTNLSPPAAMAAPQPPKFIYHLSMRQQPHSARACGFGDRDRRVIDPPPILELKITTPSVPSPTPPTELVPLATDGELYAQLRKVYYVCHCSLWSADADEDSSNMTDITSGSRATQRRLMGTLVSSPFVGHDDSTPPVTSCFFTFPDLSCRTTGRYRLHFSLVLLDPKRMVQGDKRKFLAECTSEIVRVFAAKDFPGMRGSSALTKVLKSQGCAIGVKKGIERVGERETSSASGSRAGAAARKEREEAIRNVAAVVATAGAAGGNMLPQEGEALAADGDDDEGPGS